MGETTKTLHIGTDSQVVVGSAKTLLGELLPSKRVIVITDGTIDRLHKGLFAEYETIVIGSGESIKTLQTAGNIYDQLIEMGADRSTFILGIGGGIVTDITGFVASTYMRGLEFGFISTTLLGQVDASVGGKNGVNIGGYKNMVGVFNQPRFVICAPELLQTLPDREFRAGLAEIIKAAIIADAPLFERLEGCSFEQLRTDSALLEEMIFSAISIKADIVIRDEREAGERRKLNLGHTLAHAIEKCSSAMNHGEAVAVGISLISHLAQREGLLSEADLQRINSLLTSMGFELTAPVDIKKLLKATQRDKKAEGDHIYIVLPTSIGECTVQQMPMGEFTNLF